MPMSSSTSACVISSAKELMSVVPFIDVKPRGRSARPVCCTASLKGNNNLLSVGELAGRARVPIRQQFPLFSDGRAVATQHPTAVIAISRRQGRTPNLR
jgi:hypothetical protein